jgi:hypothetical protein
MYYTTVRATAQLLNLSIAAIYKRIRLQKTEFIVWGKNYLIPTKLIAQEIGISEDVLLKNMNRQRLPIWECEFFEEQTQKERNY